MLDLLTMHVMASLVVIVSGVTYLTETLLRKDGPAGRLWSAAFLAGIVTVVSYLVWVSSPGAFVAVAIGNGAFAATSAFVWLGTRAFNGRRQRAAGWLGAVGVTGATVAVLFAGPNGGDWAGAPTMFVAIAAFALLAAIETRSGALRRRSSAVGLTVVLLIEAGFFVARLFVMALVGIDSAVFRTWFGSETASMLTATLTIVTLVATSVLRAAESAPRGNRESYVVHVGTDGIIVSESFRSVVSTMLERAERVNDTMCVLALRFDDLRRMAVAFGPEEADAFAAAWRAGVRRYSPTASLVGEGSPTTLLVAFVTTSFADVQRIAGIMHRRLLDDFAALGVSVVPVVGVGIALTTSVGYDFLRLTAAAEAAAGRAAESSDASVIIADD